MTSFKFNFSGTADDTQQLEDKAEIKWFDSEQVIPNEDQLKNFENVITHAKMFTYGDIEIGHVLLDKSQVDENLVDEHCDLVTGKYEGGLKIWECTYDLIEYLTENEESKDWEKKNILDLGCGAGILGIYAFLNGSLVTFQDYNKEVIEKITIPNVLLNIEDEDRENDISKCTFYCGDWASFDKKLSENVQYDIILTSETIYNVQNYDKLINLIINRLSKSGVAYVAAKTYYFGVGGGTRQFEADVNKTGVLKSEVVWKSAGGIQREILKINHVKS
ncbi:histidine protein methyltransferase 1 homolog [Epargyreus clarus]|uniref:histidine protein methyltransferase 1 homolog n=1 Tax=Epargyreus clarus TaxID=520877 RepID=UPI003C2FB77B